MTSGKFQTDRCERVLRRCVLLEGPWNDIIPRPELVGKIHSAFEGTTRCSSRDMRAQNYLIFVHELVSVSPVSFSDSGANFQEFASPAHFFRGICMAKGALGKLGKIMSLSMICMSRQIAYSFPMI